MSTKIGQFEILSELAKSSTGAVYKANDPESGQTIAVKAIQLSAFGEGAMALEQALLAEADSTKALSSPNITTVYGAGEIEGQFCAAMEYVQGNSIATMLARKEGFSIWDLLDIGRQLCSGLDHAASHNVVHHSFEPAKIMCGWDGTVKILGFGVSRVGDFVHYVDGGVSSILNYMSPEQVRGEAIDTRSNLFSLGAIFYEMVTERKAFDGADAESLRECIAEGMPVPPIQVNPKIHGLLSDLIMKALAKDPAERYQSGREMLEDLEKCKESKPSAAKKAEAPKAAAVSNAAAAEAKAKLATPAAPKIAAAAPVQTAAKAAPVRPQAAQTPAVASPNPKVTVTSPAETQPQSFASAAKTHSPKAAAAAAGISHSDHGIPANSGAENEGPSEYTSKNAFGEAGAPSAYMSSAVAEPETSPAPKITVDPMMAEGGSGAAKGTSFSDIAELPPLKEIYIAPPPPPEPLPAVSSTPTPIDFRGGKTDEKPKVQPREVAEKAIQEIKNVPPKLIFYALGAAGILILGIGIAVTIYIHQQNADDDASAGRTTSVAESTPAQPEATPTTPKAEAKPEPTASEPVENTERTAAPVAATRSRSARKKAPEAAPVLLPGQLAVDSTPQGAQVTIDGKSDPTWVTPFSLTNVQPGAHSVTVSKSGYSTDTRTIQVTSGNRASSAIRLMQLSATLVVKSNPPGATIYVDGRAVGTKTPAQVSIDKGQHTVLVRLSGYLDETMDTQFVLGQTFNFSPTLRPLGDADSIHTIGKMSKLFGGKGAQAGQATLTIHTQPKGAQIAVNQHMLEKTSPVDVALDPGNYVVDITLSGYAPIHKIVTADKGGKVAIDEVLQRQ